MVVGASRGLGRGIALAFDEAGAPVVAVARSRHALDELVAAGKNVEAESADAADATRRGACWTGQATGSHPGCRCESGDAVTCAPDVGDVLRQLAHRCEDRVHVASRGAAAPLPPGSRVIVVSSGAAINGSPASGGYAGARPPSGSSPDTPTRRRAFRVSTSPSPRSCRG